MTDQQQTTLGRPSKYKPEFCDQVIELGKKGFSQCEMASHFEVSRTTLGNWAESHDAFMTAYARANDESQAWWETQGREALGNRDFHANLWAKTMSSRFRGDYGERRVVEGDPDKPQEVAISAAGELGRAIAFILAQAQADKGGG